MAAGGPLPADEEARLALLREAGCDEVRHVRVMLTEHLRATRDVIAGWGAPDAWCDAALFHAVYGTEELHPRNPKPPPDEAQRARVRAVIGEEAERLAWLFGSLDLVTFIDRAARGVAGPLPARRGVAPVAITPEEERALANLVVANAVEQTDRRHRGHRRRTRSLVRLRRLLLPGALAALKRERSLRRRLFARYGPRAASSRA